MKSLFIFFFTILIFSSCTKGYDLDYKKYKSYYEVSVIYLHRNYSIFFDDSLKENVVKVDNKYPLCAELDSLFKLQPLEAVYIYKDSTIIFNAAYSGTDLKSTGISLVCVNNESKINEMKTKVNELITHEDKGWFKFKTTTSLAD